MTLRDKLDWRSEAEPHSPAEDRRGEREGLRMVSRDEVMAALAAIPGPDGRASLPIRARSPA